MGVGDHAIMREVEVLEPRERAGILSDRLCAVDGADDLHRDLPHRASIAISPVACAPSIGNETLHRHRKGAQLRLRAATEQTGLYRIREIRLHALVEAQVTTAIESIVATTFSS